MAPRTFVIRPTPARDLAECRCCLRGGSIMGHIALRKTKRIAPDTVGGRYNGRHWTRRPDTAQCERPADRRSAGMLAVPRDNADGTHARQPNAVRFTRAELAELNDSVRAIKIEGQRLPDGVPPCQEWRRRPSKGSHGVVAPAVGPPRQNCVDTRSPSLRTSEPDHFHTRK